MSSIRFRINQNLMKLVILVAYPYNTYYCLVDINECLYLNGGCDQVCNNYKGGHSCACRRGYTLRSGKHCLGAFIQDLSNYSIKGTLRIQWKFFPFGHKFLKNKLTDIVFIIANDSKRMRLPRSK